MLQKGHSINEKFVLRLRDGVSSIEGNPSARFGYKLGSATTDTRDGVWVDWAWERDCFELRNDRLGFFPMFYREDKAGFGVSNQIVNLLDSASSTELDDAAMAVFLRLGFFLGNDTPFKRIRALPPGSRLSWAGNGLRCEPVAVQSDLKPHSITRSAAIREYGELFQSAVEKFTSGLTEKFAVPLSGGRDSRHILLALLKAGRRPDCCITVRQIPPLSDGDVDIASEVTSFDHLNHVILPRVKAIVGAELEKNRLTNFCSSEHAWIFPLRLFVSQQRFTTVFDGIGGDVLSAGLFLDEARLRLYEEGKFRQLAENILGPEGYLPGMISASFYKKWSRELAIDHLIPELTKYSDRQNPVGQFYFWNRTRRHIAASFWGIVNGSCHVFAPYLSREVYEFLAALPAAFFLDHTFHTETISHSYPEHAKLRYEAKGNTEARSDWLSIADHAWDAIRYCVLTGTRTEFVNRSFFLPRIVKGLVNVAYGTTLPTLFRRAIYLTQLESITQVHELPRRTDG